MIKIFEIFYALVFSRTIFQRFFQYLYVFSLKGMGYLNYHNLTISGELNVVKNIKIRRAPVIFDVGAADNSEFLRHVYARFPKARVFAFEPNELAYKQLLKNKPNVLVKIYKLGMGDKNSKNILYDYSKSFSTQHARIHGGVIDKSKNQKNSSQIIKITTIDSFTKKNGIEYIDFLKIDVEGFDYKVLIGANDLIKNRRIKYIQFEFNEMCVDNRVFLSDFITLLKDYNLYRLLPTDLVPISPYRPWLSEIFSFQNILAIRK